MPFKSKAQARFMFSQHPQIAKEFAAKTKSIKALPDYVKPDHSHPYSTNPSTTKGGKAAACLICGQGREAHTIG